MDSLRCDICSISFASLSALHRHQSTVHKSSITICCPLCKARFRDNYTFQKHFTTHQNPLPPPPSPIIVPTKPKKVRNGVFDCFVCDQEVVVGRYKEHLKGHMEEVERDGEELRDLVQLFGDTCERVSATLGSFVQQAAQPRSLE